MGERGGAPKRRVCLRPKKGVTCISEVKAQPRGSLSSLKSLSRGCSLESEK